MNETDSHKCSFEQQNVIIKHSNATIVAKMSSADLVASITPKNAEQNIQIFKLQIQMHYDTSQS